MKIEALTEPQVVEVEVSIEDVLAQIGSLPMNESRAAVINAISVSLKVLKGIAENNLIDALNADQRKVVAEALLYCCAKFDPPAVWVAS